ncbi:MAG: metal-dependent hydrolase [Vicinamibacterales bacterium]
MPSPVGHALGGVIVGQVLTPGRAWLLAVVAVAPDLDFLWGRHNMETHSVGAALVVGLVALAAGGGRDVRFALACALAVISHVFFDWLGSDTTPPLGVMALWPWSSEYHFADAFLFEAISRRYWLDNFWMHNVWAVGREVLMLGPIAGALWWWRTKDNTKTTKVTKDKQIDSSSWPS